MAKLEDETATGSESPVTLQQAIATLVAAWRDDPDVGGYRHGWLCNIAVHFQDCAPPEWSRADTHRVSNEAADRFLRSLEHTAEISAEPVREAGSESHAGRTGSAPPVDIDRTAQLRKVLNNRLV